MRDDDYYITKALEVAQHSPDPSTQVGCVIVNPAGDIVIDGHNTFPPGILDTDQRRVRPDKLIWIEHSERMAIYRAARHGIAVAGCRMYLTWFPCVECARALIASGIVEIIGMQKPTASKSDDTLEKARIMLTEAKVAFRYVEWRTSCSIST